MMKRLLPLALLALWAPAALAFPPCPVSPVEIDPLDSLPGDPLYQVLFSGAGDKELLDEVMVPVLRAALPPRPGSGNCRTGASSVVLPGPNASDDSLAEGPAYAPRSAVGLLALPDLRQTEVGTSVVYRYDFSVATIALPAVGDWVDVLQLEFRRNDTPTGKSMPSTFYRARIHQIAENALPVVEVIEVRRSADEVPKITETLVATIPLNPNTVATPISLRWSQINHAYKPDGGSIGTIAVGSAVVVGIPPEQSLIGNPVDAIFEVLESGHTVVYEAPLPDQWADLLSTGILNYHSPSIAEGSLTQAAYLREETLSVEE